MVGVRGVLADLGEEALLELGEELEVEQIVGRERCQAPPEREGGGRGGSEGGREREGEKEGEGERE